MHDLIVEEGTRVRLAYAPEDVVIVPDDYVLQVPVSTPPPVRVGSGDIRIVAALVNPRGVERGQETVTVLNATHFDIDLTGWFVADTSGQQPLSGMISSGEAIRIKLGSGVQLSNTRDTLTILDTQRNIIDQVSYQKRDLPAEGYSKVF